MQNRTGKRTGIWLALAVALGFHTVILFLPITRQTPPVHDTSTQIELQLTTFQTQNPVGQVPAQPSDPALPKPMPEQVAEAAPEPTKSVVETISKTNSTPEIPKLATQTLSWDLEHDLDDMSESVKNRLTNAILSRQFITEESAADRLFGKPLEQNNTELHAEFHYPARQDLISMLDQPMPDLPFAYTPGLIHFAYDPGVKGDLQRFWDVITPEFGWRTKNGTEFKCVWVLIIGACGWK